jgi:hypothetical protein
MGGRMFSFLFYLSFIKNSNLGDNFRMVSIRALISLDCFLWEDFSKRSPTPPNDLVTLTLNLKPWLYPLIGMHQDCDILHECSLRWDFSTGIKTFDLLTLIVDLLFENFNHSSRPPGTVVRAEGQSSGNVCVPVWIPLWDVGVGPSGETV